MKRNDAQSLPRAARGFTLVELLIAGVIAAFVLSSISMSLAQLGRAKNTSKTRFDAFMRADAALNVIRRDVAAVVRADDLFYTRLLITHATRTIDGQEFDRDEILVFNTRLRNVRQVEFNGEGCEYETQYRIADDDYGPVLWQRRDALPDEYLLAGGVITPLVEGVVGLSIEAYDGEAWYGDWDSDIHGLPLAVRVGVIASGHRGPADVYGLKPAPRAALRTSIAIDRVIPPRDLFEALEEEEEESEEDAAETGEEEEIPEDEMPPEIPEGIIVPDEGEGEGGEVEPRRGPRRGEPGQRDRGRPGGSRRPPSGGSAPGETGTSGGPR